MTISFELQSFLPQTIRNNHASFACIDEPLVKKVFQFTILQCLFLSSGTGAAGFISMIEPSKLVEKAIRMLNPTWNSVKLRAIA